MNNRKGTFEFEEGGRRYTCRMEGPSGGRADSWWWFDVQGDTNRYAPFRAVARDTEASVRDRVVAYYEERLASRNRIEPRRFGRPRTAAPAAPGAAAAPPAPAVPTNGTG